MGLFSWLTKSTASSSTGSAASSSAPNSAPASASPAAASAPASHVSPGATSSATPGPTPDAPREARIFALGAEMLKHAREHKSGVLSSKFYSDAIMNWSMKDQNFKVQMFRFVDAFPTLRTPDSIYEHLTDYLSQPGVKVPAAIDAVIKAGAMLKSVAASQIGSQIKGMASKFIAGTDAASALPQLQTLWKDGIAFSVDLLGEACVSDAEADSYQAKYLDLVQNLPAQVGSWAANERLESDAWGPIPRTNVSIKISSLSARCDPIDPEGAMRDLMSRLLPILETARDRGVFVNFDMEQFSMKDFTIELFQRCCEKVNFQAGLAMQAYLKSGPDDAKRVADWARRTGRVVTVRLVKGAYWDYETINAEMKGWPCPVWGTKWQTDACFERMSEIFLDAAPATNSPGGGIKLALGSHNVRSIASALAGLEARKLPRSAIELQMLHGMADQLKYAAAEMGLRVREYVPVGEMIPGMAYLVRRLLENTSNESWLKAGFMDQADAGVLLRAPGPAANSSQPAAPTDLLAVAPERHALSPAPKGVGNERAFVNEPFRDFSQARQREAFAAAIARSTVPRIASDKSADDARSMVARAQGLFPAWRDVDARTRAQVLVHAASLMRVQHDGLAGVMIRETGKTWREADADVCEAIDFCEYYARYAPPLFDRQRLGKFIGELDELWYEPRGVSVVISPWNFPLAIACGMTTAALVTGNPVILKPAEQSPGVASILVDTLQASLAKLGLPRDVVQFCPGQGHVVGATLVRDPRVALIAFTGSLEVGLNIFQAAGVTDIASGQRVLKKVVCEMGGKNAIIVDSSADLDEAVLGVRHSAFGYQGQKCSACSRCIVVDPAGPDGEATRVFVRRLVEATRSLTIADPLASGADVGPVIDAEARAKILGYIEQAKKQSTLELASPLPPGLEERTAKGFVSPHIFSRVMPDHTIAQEEIFGPVLAIMHAKTFDEALAIANASPFKLTGAVYSRKPTHIEKAKREFRVGNLYINRGSTGALVGRQPFGGFGFSGVGTKAGGPDYLQHFVEPRCSTENTLRRGFAPEL
ncbi:MAG: proline dehydrogenase family protein [Planctomycetota bacterium]|nr:proline dehydrogenase family protein [Planctomycetota bacterium]